MIDDTQQSEDNKNRLATEQKLIWLIATLIIGTWLTLGSSLYFSRGLIACLLTPEDATPTSCEAGMNEPFAVGSLHHSAVMGHVRFLQSASRYEEAATLLDAEVAKGYTTTAVYYQLAKARKENAQRELAIAAYQKVIELDPNDFEAHKEILSLHVDARNYDAARATMNEYISRVPTDPYAYDWLSWVERGDGHHAEALAAIDKAIELNPDFSHYYRDRAFSLIELSRWDEALVAHSKSIEISPTDDGYLNNRAKLYNMLGRHEEAKSDLLKAIEVSTDPDLVLDLATQHRFLGEYEEADRVLSKVLEENPDEFSIQNQRVYLYIDKQDYAAALKVVEELAASREPDDLEVRFLRHVISSRQGNYVEAIKGLKSLLPDWQDSEALHLELGIALVKMNAPAAAMTWFDKAIALGTNNSWNWSARATASGALQDWPRVIADANKALELLPGNSEALTQRALARKAMNDTAGALTDLRNAVRFEPGNLESRIALEAMLKETSAASP
jgi:tetratricopeptide (TPR) repeat protein